MGPGPTLGLSHPFSTLLVGRRFPGSWKQNGLGQQSSAASSALESGAGEGEVRQHLRPLGEVGEGQTGSRGFLHGAPRELDLRITVLRLLL